MGAEMEGQAPAFRHGVLTLPPSAVSALGLPFRETISANLASDDEIQVDSYRSVILWHGVEREIDVLSLGQRPLLGTALLDGYELVAQFAEGGLVTVEAL